MIKNLISKLQQYISEKHYGKILIIILLYICSVVLVVLTLLTVIKFIAMYYETIILLVVGIAIFVYWIKERREEKVKLAKVEADKVKTELVDTAKAFAELNYSYSLQAVYITLREMADKLKLAVPNIMSEIESPTHYFQRGTDVIYQFLCLKHGEVDTNAIKEVLQRRIVQKLQAGEFTGITQSMYYYEGNFYPILFIEDIQDIGTYLQINVAFVNESYCKNYVLKQQLNKQIQQYQNTDISDKDF